MTDMNQGKTEKVSGGTETEHPKAPAVRQNVLYRYLT